MILSLSDGYSTDEEIKEKSEKKYSNACDGCGFKTDTNRRYISLQQIQKHQCLNRIINCIQCGKSFRSSQEVKRHMTSKHIPNEYFHFKYNIEILKQNN